MKHHIEYLIKSYGSHPAFYSRKHNGKDLPLFYIYDSYLIKKDAWASLLQPDGSHSLRNTDYDSIFIGLVVENNHKEELLGAGFDGFYTYFASDGFTYGSGTRNWKHLADYASINQLLFIPSVGPGYIDDRVRPWNKRNTKERDNGSYYEQSFKAALDVEPPLISITSFNEWHEGTQIEKAIPKTIAGYKYLDYSPHQSDYYISLTRKWIDKFTAVT